MASDCPLAAINSSRPSERGRSIPFRFWRAPTSPTASPKVPEEQKPDATIDISEIKNIADYEWSAKLAPPGLALKERRRIRLGDHLTFLFENRETVRYQIQEMMRIERIVNPTNRARSGNLQRAHPRAGRALGHAADRIRDAAERDVSSANCSGWRATCG